MNTNFDNVPKLSLLAMYDDMCRFSNSLIVTDNDIISLVRNFEEIRKKLAITQRESITKDSVIQKLETENHELKLRLQSIRMAFAREVKAKEAIKKDYNNIRAKLLMVQELLNGEVRDRNTNFSSNLAKSQVLTMLSDIDLNAKNFNKNNSYNHPIPNDNDSTDELLFDKSDDNLDEDCCQAKMRKVDNEPIYAKPQKNKSFTYLTNAQTNTKPAVAHYTTIDEEDENNDGLFNTCFVSNDEVKTRKSYNKIIVDDNLETETAKTSSSPTSLKSDTATIKSTSTESSAKSVSTLNRQFSNAIYSKVKILGSTSRLEPERLDTRQHTFQQKKAFRPMTCIPCGKSIGFCSNCIICVDCRGITHPRCRDQLPKPCIPYFDGPGLRKMTSSSSIFFRSKNGNMLMIGDFTPTNTRPYVPALLIHCCNEINRRIDAALKDPKVIANPSECSPVIGLYRLCGVDREIRELSGKILDAKNGFPNLSSVADINAICGVVKLFLRSLDDPLVTRILWQDFVRSAEHVEKNATSDMAELPDSDYDSRGEELDSSNEELHESLQVLKEVVIQLPTANRDSLAFLFLHLRHIVDAYAVTRMNVDSLAKIFAPTIIGSSVLRTTMTNIISENMKQVTVMHALFRISRHFWTGILRDPNFTLSKEKTDRKSLNSSLKTHIKKISSTSLRDLIGIDKQQCDKKDLDISGNHIKGLSSYKTTSTLSNAKQMCPNKTSKNIRQRSSVNLHLNALY